MKPTSSTTAQRTKPELTFWQIWNMSFGFLGIQFGFALQLANTSRIFETLGAAIDDIPILWLAAPITGLIVQPIIGYFSDRTWTKLGRRRPYFLGGALIASLALIVMPNSPVLWIAAGMLWVMDSAFNVAMEPFRAFVGDNLPDQQRTSGFAMQSFFIGLGAVVASMLPFILTKFGVANEAAEGIIPDSVKWSYYVGAVVFIAAIVWTVRKSFEYSPEELKSFSNPNDKSYQEKRTVENIRTFGKKQTTFGGAMTLIGGAGTFWIFNLGLEKELYVLSVGLLLFGVILLVAGQMQKGGKRKNDFLTIVNDLYSIPKTMKQLAWVQFFSWFALFAMWIYTTQAVTAHIYGTSDTTSELYNEGGNWVGVCFAVYNGVAMLAAFFLPILAKKYNRKITHVICLLLGSLGITSIFFITDPNWLLLSMVGIGFAWASILAMPYAILTGSLPAEKMGYYMGVFNFFIVIPQIVAAAILGFLIQKMFDGDAIYAMLIGGGAYILAAVLTLFVDDPE